MREVLECGGCPGCPLGVDNRIERSPPDAMPRPKPRLFHVLVLERPYERNCETGSARLRADWQAHIRQWDPCAGESVLDVHGGFAPILWFLYGLRPCRSTGRGVAGTAEVDGSDPVFGLPGSAVQRTGVCTPMPPSRRVAPVLIHPLREGHGAGAGRQPRVRRVAGALNMIIGSNAIWPE